MSRVFERVQVSPVIGVISDCPRNYANQNIISESYRNNPDNPDNLAEPRVDAAAQHRVFAPRDTCPTPKLNIPAYPVEAEGITTTRKKRVPDLNARTPAGRPQDAQRIGARHGR